MTDQNWPLYEVFIRAQSGLSHRHVGSLHAADDMMEDAGDAVEEAADDMMEDAGDMAEEAVDEVVDDVVEEVTD